MNDLTYPAAEWAVLGTCLAMPQFLSRIEDDTIFSLNETKALVCALRDMEARGTPFDHVTLTRFLLVDGSLSSEQVTLIFGELNNVPATEATGSYYLGELQRVAVQRKAYTAGVTALEAIRISRDPLSELRKLANLTESLNAETESKGAPLLPLMDISTGDLDPRKTVLGNRFLCVGGAMLFIGPSGIGKSSASVQQDVYWALGREAFGIRPARPLRILTVQAENDAEDLAEMRDGVCRGRHLSAEDRETVRANVFYETECGRTGAEFLAYVDSRLRLAQFDLLRIDPLLAYLGADVNDAAKTAEFLRTGLNPLLARHGVACIVNHHTPKVTNRDTSNWRGSDWMYAGAGSADVTNWARAALVIDPTHAPHVFKFIAAKRGNRIGWVDDNGERETMRYFCHASDGLYWRPAEADDMQAVEDATAARKSGKTVKTVADMKALVPTVGAIPKKELLELAMARGFSKHSADSTLKELLEMEEVFRWQIKRSGTNPEVRISRHEQTLAEVNG